MSNEKQIKSKTDVGKPQGSTSGIDKLKPTTTSKNNAPKKKS